MRNLRKLFVAIAGALALTAGASHAATDYTDIWWVPAESGWGMNLIQNGDTIFATWFVYDIDGAPTWYVAALKRDVNGNFIGDVAEAKGTFFGVPWVPGNASGKLVGSATFAPSTLNAYQATLAYTITGVGAATKSIERQTLAPIPLTGTFAGGQSGTYSGCSAANNNFAYVDRYDLVVTQPSASTVKLQFNFTSNLACSFTGTLEQHGMQFNLNNATYACSNGLSTKATVSELRRTAAGLEGKFVAPNVGGNCKETANFAAAL